VWKNSGYDFKVLVAKVFGKSLKRPLTMFPWEQQVETLLKKAGTTHTSVYSNAVYGFVVCGYKSIYSKCSCTSTSLFGCCMQH
jgi:hypothetical protein